MDGKTNRRAVTDEWRAEVRAELAERGMTLRELGRRLDVTHASLSQLLSGKVAASPQVEPISELLNICLPDLALVDPVIAEIADILRNLDQDGLSTIRQTAILLAKKNTQDS